MRYLYVYKCMFITCIFTKTVQRRLWPNNQQKKNLLTQQHVWKLAECRAVMHQSRDVTQRNTSYTFSIVPKATRHTLNMPFFNFNFEAYSYGAALPTVRSIEVNTSQQSNSNTNTDVDNSLFRYVSHNHSWEKSEKETISLRVSYFSILSSISVYKYLQRTTNINLTI